MSTTSGAPSSSPSPAARARRVTNDRVTNEFIASRDDSLLHKDDQPFSIEDAKKRSRPLPSNIDANTHDASAQSPQTGGVSFAGRRVWTTEHPPRVPACPSVDHARDLMLVLSALTETQTNLRLLGPLVIRLGDPQATEDITTAFRIIALSSQFLLSSDLPSAYSALKDAWTTIQMLEDRVEQGVTGAPMPQDPSLTGMPNPVRNIPPSSTAGFLPLDRVSAMERRSYATTALAGGPKPCVEIRAIASHVPSKAKANANANMEQKAPRTKVRDPPLPNQNDPEIMVKRLRVFMDRTQLSQKQLQSWDKQKGLPKSHSQTMVNSSRSRKQLQQGIVLKKWNGDPLISLEKSEQHISAALTMQKFQENCNTSSNDWAGAAGPYSSKSAEASPQTGESGVPSNPLSILADAIDAIAPTNIAPAVMRMFPQSPLAPLFTKS